MNILPLLQITKVVLSKGWRCLECTVCEACGQATDPGRLLLCDDCDISYHTYCLDPPLQNVPKDSWKCKWWVTLWSCNPNGNQTENDLKINLILFEFTRSIEQVFILNAWLFVVIINMSGIWPNVIENTPEKSFLFFFFCFNSTIAS